MINRIKYIRGRKDIVFALHSIFQIFKNIFVRDYALWPFLLSSQKVAPKRFKHVFDEGFGKAAEIHSVLLVSAFLGDICEHL